MRSWVLRILAVGLPLALVGSLVQILRKNKCRSLLGYTLCINTLSHQGENSSESLSVARITPQPRNPTQCCPQTFNGQLTQKIRNVSILTKAEMELIEQRAGLYRCKRCHPQYANILLITIANSGYRSMLNNWECFAESLGLDWVVVALDDDLYNDLGPSRAMRARGRSNKRGVASSNAPGFRRVTTLKLSVMVMLMKAVSLDIVMSDPDNVFRKDPFQHDTSLGSLMASGMYDYIYQKNKPSKWHTMDNEGNTGFFYIANSRQEKTRYFQNLFEGGIELCKRGSGGDNDQTCFWKYLRPIFRLGQGRDPAAFHCATFCGNESTSTQGIEEAREFRFCDLHPFEFPAGTWPKQRGYLESVVAYHANWVAGFQGKIAKLKEVNLWNEIFAKGICKDH